MPDPDLFNHRPMMGVIEDVMAERQRQFAKWGDQNHDPFVYLSIIQEEAGEAAEAALKALYEGGMTLADYQRERVEVAATAVAAIECVDRGTWRANPTPRLGTDKEARP